jgi:branched-chain amino acid transport system permease protein
MNNRDKILYFIYLHRNGLTVLSLSLLLALYPLFYGNPYILGLTNLIGIYTIVVLGLNLFIGYAGQISLGHASFFALGAYGSALLTTEWGVWPWPSIALVALGTAVIALLVGIPALRLHGHYLAMATLGFNIVIYTVLVQWDELTGGPSGFYGVPSLSLGSWQFDSDLKLHYLVWAVALICLMLGLNLVRSGVGRGLAALAGDEVAARPWVLIPARPKSRFLSCRLCWPRWREASTRTLSVLSAPTLSASSLPSTLSPWSSSAGSVRFGAACSVRPY